MSRLAQPSNALMAPAVTRAMMPIIQISRRLDNSDNAAEEKRSRPVDTR